MRLQYNLERLGSDTDAFMMEVGTTSDIYCTNSSLSDLRSLLDSLSGFYFNNVYQEDIDGYRADLDHVKSDWYNCLEQTSSNPILLNPIEHQSDSLLEQMRSLLPLIENPSDRAFSGEMIDFSRSIMLSRNAECQEQIASDADFTALQQVSGIGMCGGRMADCQRQFNLVRAKWDQCINN